MPIFFFIAGQCLVRVVRYEACRSVPLRGIISLAYISVFYTFFSGSARGLLIFIALDAAFPSFGQQLSRVKVCLCNQAKCVMEMGGPGR